MFIRPSLHYITIPWPIMLNLQDAAGPKICSEIDFSNTCAGVQSLETDGEPRVLTPVIEPSEIINPEFRKIFAMRITEEWISIT